MYYIVDLAVAVGPQREDRIGGSERLIYYRYHYNYYCYCYYLYYYYSVCYCYYITCSKAKPRASCLPMWLSRKSSSSSAQSGEANAWASSAAPWLRMPFHARFRYVRVLLCESASKSFTTAVDRMPQRLNRIAIITTINRITIITTINRIAIITIINRIA